MSGVELWLRQVCPFVMTSTLGLYELNINALNAQKEEEEEVYEDKDDQDDQDYEDDENDEEEDEDNEGDEDDQDREDEEDVDCLRRSSQVALRLCGEEVRQKVKEE